MNVKLLRRIKRHILAEPRRFFMSGWVRRQFSKLQKTFRGDREKEQRFAPCGTAACIGGWAVILSGMKTPDDLVGAFAIQPLARLALGLRPDFFDAQLFNAGHWPNPFATQYANAKTPKTRAKIAAARIDHLIKTGE